MDIRTQKELLETVKENYQEIAGLYNETRKKHLMPLWGELAEMAEKIEEGSKILDVGCGNGKLLRIFENKKIDYLGVDSSGEMLKYARANYPAKKFLTGDILKLGDLPEIDFDYVYCVAVLHHLPGKNLRVEALRQMKNKIAPNGRIIIAVWNLWQNPERRKYIFKYFFLRLIGKNKMDFGDILFDWKNSRGETVSRRYYHAFTKKELKNIAKAAGLKIEKIIKNKFNYYLILKK